MNVYTLIDPDDLKVKYVGITKRSPEWRLKIHLKDAKRNLKRSGYLSKKEKWMISLLISGKTPMIHTVYSDLSMEEASEQEKQLIMKYKKECDGGTLKNVMKGGF